jgi:hypothetical protein
MICAYVVYPVEKEDVRKCLRKFIFEHPAVVVHVCCHEGALDGAPVAQKLYFVHQTCDRPRTYESSKDWH